MPLSPRDRRALGGGGAVIVALLVFLLFRSGDSSEPAPVDIVPQQAQPAPPPAAAMAAPPQTDASQLRLFGVMGAGAVLGFADGSQRYVPIGRDVLPGLRLVRVEVRHAVLQSAGGEIRLGFDGVAAAPAAPPGQAATAPTGEAALREETTRYRLGLAPRTQSGRVTGFAVRPGADLPALARAGIRPGDVIVSVNGSTFDEERMLELAWQLANSTRAEFEVERGGRRVRMALEGR